jgi:hypothetical protein
MKSKIRASAICIPELIRRGIRHLFPALQARAYVRSVWRWELWRDGKRIDCAAFWSANMVVGQGLDHALDVVFKGGTALSTWYVALFENNHTPATGDTYQTPGYTECTAYDEATRPACTFGSISSHVIDNSASKASFTMNATKTLYGAALVAGANAATKGNTAAGNFLFFAAKFATAVPVEATDVFKVTMSVESSDVP